MQEPMSVPRKVKQLDNDVHSIYELLGVIGTTQAEHGVRLDGIDTRLAVIGTTQAEHGVRLDGIEATQTHHTARLDGIDTSLAGVDSRLEGLDGKLDTVLELLRTGGRSNS